jgi:hypothetical protein
MMEYLRLDPPVKRGTQTRCGALVSRRFPQRLPLHSTVK